MSIVKNMKKVNPHKSEDFLLVIIYLYKKYRHVKKNYKTYGV